MLPEKRKENWLPSIFNDLFDNEWLSKSRTSAPAINVKETGKKYKVEVAAPGMTKDDFNIRIDEDTDCLVISMEKREEKEDKNGEKDEEGRYLRREFSYSQSQQVLALPDNVDKENIAAKMDHGVLKIELPKLSDKQIQQKQRLIEIQ
jgi:HSP20 family protein